MAKNRNRNQTSLKLDAEVAAPVEEVSVVEPTVKEPKLTQKKSDELTKFDAGKMVDLTSTPVDSGNSKLVTDDTGAISTVGQILTKKLQNESSTPEEYSAAVQVGNQLDNTIDDQSNSPQTGVALDNAVTAQPQTFDYSGDYAVAPALANSPALDVSNPEAPSVMSHGMGNQDILGGLTPEERMQYQAYYNAIPKKKPVERAIEQLGVQDYFPSGKDNIAVGSYSRKTLGSGNIYVAGGGMLPFSILDARKRALEKDQQEKQALADKIKSFSVHTAKQFDTQFGDNVQDKLMNYYDAAGGDIGRLNDPSDPLGQDYLRFIDNAPRVANEISDVDAKVQNVLDAYNGVERDAQGNPKQTGIRKYVPEETLKLAYDWMNGKTAMLDDMLSGKVKPSDYSEKFKSYDNSYALADEKLKEIAKNPDIMPLNAKMNFDTKTEDGVKNALNAREAISKASGRDYDTFIQVTRKFFDTDKIEGIVDGFFSQDNIYKGKSEEEKKKLKSELTKYMVDNLFDQVEVKQDTQANDNLEYAELALRKKQFEYQQQEDLTKYSYAKLQGDAYIEAIYNNPNLTSVEKNNLAKSAMLKDNNYSKSGSEFFGISTQIIPLTEQESKSMYRSKLSDTYAKVKGSDGKYKLANLQDIKNDKYWTATKKGYKSKYDYADESTNWAHDDALAISKSNPNGDYSYNTAERTMNVMATTPDGKTVPGNWAGNNQKKNVIHDQVNRSLNNPVNDPETGKQKLDESGKPVFETYKLKSTLVVSKNLDDPLTQVTYDTPLETGQINKNPNVPE